MLLMIDQPQARFRTSRSTPQTRANAGERRS
jgi:hypothetical protein